MFKLHPESSCKFSDSEALNRYLFGGKGVVTLKSPTGVHHTYYFKKPLNPDVFPDDVIFVYAVHEGQKLFYVGMIENGLFRITRNSRFLYYNPIVKGTRYIMNMARSQEFLDNSKMEIYHEGICSVCGRKLVNPKSIKIGIGPKCKKQVHVQ